ncbi:MAG TPA: ice-binding family protein, partial [Planctomycetaceae bacterium]|nr:ice-binding family protein [Planctomycetaceae bacterium]
MSRSQVDRPLGKSILRMLFEESRPRARTRRLRRAAPVAAQIEILEERVLLSAVLGTADSFAVLAGSTVTNTGPSVISGDVGVSPGSEITGFPPGTVINGTIHATDAVAAQAQSDVTIAYDDLASRAPDADLTGQDLGGMTLTAGVYFFSSSAQLTGTLTLDAQGDPDAEFIFQIGSTLTTASNSSVVILNGGSPCDVFWQVGSSATLGTTTVFVGNILALTSITLDNGAGVEGSVLARNGAVTLDNNVITDVDCAQATSSISGVKFNDLNGDGIRQAGEDGLPGLTVFLDTNGNGSLDAGEKQTTTDADGSYSFTGLNAGTYLVRQSNLADSGLVQTSPNPDEITLGDDEDVTGVDFGDFFVASISGTKFEDANGDGVRNDGEGGLPGVTVFLDANGNGTLDMGETSTTTDANGDYTFTNL